MENISLQEVLRQMKLKDQNGNALPFNITCYTLNRNTKKGGDLKTYMNARLLIAKKQSGISMVALTKSVSILPKTRRNPNHFANATRNIELPNGDFKKIHIRYIDTFNGKKMVY